MRSPTTWTRLDPRLRDRELRDSLTATLHDPLWLLGRQWQLGEFRGEDAGTPIAAELTIDQRPLTRYRLGADGPTEPYWTARTNPSPPLETLVERERVRPSKAKAEHGESGSDDEARNLRLAAEAGEQFRRFLANEGLSYSVAAFADADVSAFPDVESLLLNPDEVRGDAASDRYLGVVRGRVLDGDALYRVVVRALADETGTGSDERGDTGSGASGPRNGTSGDGGPSMPLPDPAPDDVDAYRNAAERYRDWYADLYAEPDDDNVTENGDAWDTDRLEYEFAVAVGADDEQAVFGAKEYPGGRLDWYSFDYRSDEQLPIPTGIDDEIGSKETTDEVTGGEIDEEDSTRETDAETSAEETDTEDTGATDGNATKAIPAEMTLDLTPTALRYKGMPAPRWWELEDSQVNLDDIDAAPEDLSRLLLLEFALLYGNDWFEVPIDLPVGTLATVSELTVSDTFGRRTEVEHTSTEDPHPGDDSAGTSAMEPWQLFDFEMDGKRGLFVPPVLADLLETEPVEAVQFVRDEMVNVAWGLEERVEGPVGAPLDRHELDQENEREQESDQFGLPVASAADVSYRLATDVPDYWLPLLPVQDDAHQVSLHLGDLLDGSGHTNESWGRILVDDLAVPEEEVPRSGTAVRRSYQLARWIDGSTYLWSGRRKNAGRGQGSSGLRFDITEDRAGPSSGVGRGGDDSPPIALVSLQSQPPGRGTERLNDEYLAIENISGHPLTVTDWTIADTANHTYTFDQLTLAAGELVILRTGTGTDSANGHIRHWGSSWPIWNDIADEVRVADADGEVVLAQSYPDLSSVVEQSPIDIAELHVDAADDDYQALTDEYVVIENTSDGVVDLTGWVVRDIANHRYVFPDDEESVLLPGDRVTLRTGQGHDVPGTRYWGLVRPVWNNTDDAVLIYDIEGRLMAGQVY